MNIGAGFAIHVEWLVLMVTILSAAYFLDARFDSKIDSLACQMHEQNILQSQRTDKLYEMFIDLLRQEKGRT